MRSASSVTTLRASATLPASGNDSALTTIDVEDLDFITLKVVYTGASTTSTPAVRVRWKTMPDSADTTTAEGVSVSGGALVDEVWPLPVPGSGTKKAKILHLRVPGAAKSFEGAIYEYGDTANPCTAVLVEAWRGRENY